MQPKMVLNSRLSCCCPSSMGITELLGQRKLAVPDPLKSELDTGSGAQRKVGGWPTKTTFMRLSVTLETWGHICPSSWRCMSQVWNARCLKSFMFPLKAKLIIFFPPELVLRIEMYNEGPAHDLYFRNFLTPVRLCVYQLSLAVTKCQKWLT